MSRSVQSRHWAKQNISEREYKVVRMNLGSKLGWVSMTPSYVEYPGSDKRNRNPNWTDTEIARFLTILMEEPVLADLNAQRNKQVFCYVSQKMAGEGCEKSWDQCRYTAVRLLLTFKCIIILVVG